MKAATKGKNILIPNPLEAFHESARIVTSEIKNQAAASVDDSWSQLLGGGEKSQVKHQKMSGDLIAGQSIDFNVHKKPQEQPKQHEQVKRVDVAAGIDYRGEILHGERRISKETEQILSRQIEEIAAELRQLVNSSQELAVQFKDVAVEQRITKPGKYHVSLFQFVLSIVRQARMKVESSSACLSISKGKKGKKDYWSMASTQGTSFTMNNERAIATQAG